MRVWPGWAEQPGGHLYQGAGLHLQVQDVLLASITDPVHPVSEHGGADDFDIQFLLKFGPRQEIGQHVSDLLLKQGF
ncbi:MAG: hypothetical protein M3Z08_24300 [Chloroflexota bacterium]|nr:hypothetical protein [Chloroflexota bacterium]